LVVAATERELDSARAVPGARALACGIGPVEAAVRTAAALTAERPAAVLHVGIAGARGIEPTTVVIGSESVYDDADSPLVVSRAWPDAGLLEAARRALPAAPLLAIGTSARVGGSTGSPVEAMEGFAVLRAAELAGVPALEVRAISNSIDEPDRAKWRFDDALAALAEVVPILIEELRAADA
jgi:nucleoside phosphorylase